MDKAEAPGTLKESIPTARPAAPGTEASASPRVTPGRSVVLEASDLCFGGVRCELIDAAGLYDLVSGNRSRH